MHLCGCCRTSKQALYCAKCIDEGVTSNRRYAESLRTQCQTAVIQSSAQWDEKDRRLSSWRLLRAQVTSQEAECAHLQMQITSKQAELDRFIASSTACHQKPIHSNAITLVRTRYQRAITNYHTSQSQITQRILHARRVLVGEAANIFGIERVDSIWRIAGLFIPEPTSFREQDSTLLNAALLHLVHFISLVSRYLSVALPYQPTFPQQNHVGRPVIRSNAPFLHTTKFREKYVLWMSSSAKKKDGRSNAKYRQFLTAFALLAQSVAYLGWSQGVEGIGVSSGGEDNVRIPATSLLRILDEMTREVGLGTRSHEPGTALVRHLGFSLDVVKVVEAIHGPDDEQGWDIVDASTS